VVLLLLFVIAIITVTRWTIDAVPREDRLLSLTSGRAFAPARKFVRTDTRVFRLPRNTIDATLISGESPRERERERERSARTSVVSELISGLYNRANARAFYNAGESYNFMKIQSNRRSRPMKHLALALISTKCRRRKIKQREVILFSYSLGK